MSMSLILTEVEERTMNRYCPCMLRGCTIVRPPIMESKKKPRFKKVGNEFIVEWINE